jgi:Mn-dependent DtxR family transcriptional regulator
MANRNQILTAANIRYLLALKELCPENGFTRCVHVAEKLEISKPSVHAMMNSLKEMKLIEKDHYGTVHFTEEGFRLATLYEEYFAIVMSSLSDKFSDEKYLALAVCAFLAEIPPERLETLRNENESIDISQAV